MIEVNIRYGGWSYKGDLPQTLQEIPLAVDRRYIMQQLVSPYRPVALQHIAMRLLKVPRKWWRRMSPGTRIQLCDLVSDLKISDSDQPLVQEFEHRGTTYVLPKGEAMNVRAKEYAIADDYLAEFADDGTETNLLRIVATYAREKLSNEQLALRQSDWRQQLYTRDEIEARAERLADLPGEIATAVFCQAVGIKRYIHDTYSEWIFGGTPSDDDDDDDDDEDDEPAQHGVDFGWWGVFNDIAQAGVFGSIDKVHDAFIHDVCAYLVQQEQRRRKEQQRQDQLKRGHHK